MSIKASKTVIGAFVLGAICLVVAGVVFFGSGKLFTPTRKFVMYFDGSVKGLAVGAPVVFRGVKIGSVVDILLQGNLQEMTFTIPVIAKIDLNRFRMSDGEPHTAAHHQSLIDRGLRAQLQTQSLLTGQLMINFDFQPDRPARLVPDMTGYLQIPTIPTAAEELTQKLDELPLKQLVERTNAALGGMEQFLNSPDMQALPRSLNLTMAELRALLKKVDGEVGLLSADAREAFGAATVTFRRADRVLAFEDGPPAEAVRNLNQTLLAAQGSFRKFDATLDALQQTTTDERSYYQLRAALKELGEASRSLNALVDYLDRHPEALLRGKTDPEGK
jgi:paraquat-inducible protein B